MNHKLVTYLLNMRMLRVIGGMPVVLLLSLAFSAPLFARCGDYRADGDHGVDAPLRDLPVSQWVPPFAASESQSPGSFPCNGPECRNHVPVAPRPYPVRLHSVGDGLAMVLESTVNEKPLSGRFAKQERAQNSRKWVFRLERPPCCG